MWPPEGHDPGCSRPPPHGCVSAAPPSLLQKGPVKPGAHFPPVPPRALGTPGAPVSPAPSPRPSPLPRPRLPPLPGLTSSCATSRSQIATKRPPGNQTHPRGRSARLGEQDPREGQGDRCWEVGMGSGRGNKGAGTESNQGTLRSPAPCPIPKARPRLCFPRPLLAQCPG